MPKGKTELMKAREAQMTRLQELRERSVDPFVRQLDKLLSAAPSQETLSEFAETKPNDWASMVKTMANLSGYADRTEVKLGGVIAQISDMSDAQLIEMMRLLMDQKKAVDLDADLSSNV